MRRVPLSIGLTGADALPYVGGSTAEAVGKRQTAEDQRQRIARICLSSAVVVHREQQQQQKVGIHLILLKSYISTQHATMRGIDRYIICSYDGAYAPRSGL